MEKEKLSYELGKVIAFCLFRIIPRCQVVGRENFPSRGPLIIVGNHPSHLEPVLGVTVFPWQVRVLADGGLRKVPIVGWFVKLFNPIFLEEGKSNKKAFEKALRVLQKGGIIGIAPEGGINPKGLFEANVQRGAAVLALWSGAPILPVAFLGTDKPYKKLFFDFLKFMRPRFEIRIGKPFWLTEKPLKRIPKKLSREASSQIIRKIAELLPEEKRGRCDRGGKNG